MKTMYIEGVTLNELLSPTKLAFENYKPNASMSLFKYARDVASGFAGVFNDGLFAAVGKRISVMFAENSTTDVVHLDSAVQNWLRSNNYIKLSLVQVYRPVGLSSTYLEFIEKLEDAYSYVSGIDKDALAPLESFLMTVMNNPTLLTSASLTLSPCKYTPKAIDKLSTDMGECFDKDDLSDRYNWDQAVARNADYVEADRRIGKLVAGVSALGIANIRARIESIFQITESIAKNIKANPENAAMTKHIADKLAAEITVAAQAVEFLAMVVSQIQIMSVAVTDTNKHLKKLESAF